MFLKYFRMTSRKSEELLRMLAPSLMKESCFRNTISAEERFYVTLRHAVAGDSHTIISINYSLSPTMVGRIIKETSGIIWDTLFLKGYLKAPISKNEWKKIANDFEKRRNFHNCLGDTDRKQVVT